MKREWLWIALIFALAAFFRFYHITLTPAGLYPDEAVNGNNALEALATGDFRLFYPENNGREGLFINIQAVSVHLFGNNPWALRLVSACIGTLTIIGVWLLTKELFHAKALLSPSRELWAKVVPLIAAFFVATSFWHINFSRIGFRAIMVPFLMSFGAYWLLNGLRTGKFSSMALGGLAIGGGFNTYTAFRFVPLALAPPILWYVVQWWKTKRPVANERIPRSIFFFLLFAFIAAAPLGFYYVRHPADFIGRTAPISVFHGNFRNSLHEFVRSTVLTLGMFNVRGDCNPRHNLQCSPELFWPVGILFLVGVTMMIRNLFSVDSERQLPALVLASWFFFLMFPATLTFEELPHALRSIGLIPVSYILAALGFGVLAELAADRFTARQQLVATFIVLTIIAVQAYRTYFMQFANSRATFYAFSEDMTEMGRYLASLPDSTKKIIIVDRPGFDMRGIPVPAATVMYLTDTFLPQRRAEKNLTYVLPQAVNSIAPAASPTVIVPLLPSDTELFSKLKQRFPQFSEKHIEDFAILANF